MRLISPVIPPEKGDELRIEILARQSPLPLGERAKVRGAGLELQVEPINGYRRTLSRLSRHNPTGQAAVEFAIVLPVLLMLLVGLVNLGFLINGQIILTQAAWEGARVGATLNPASGDGDEQIIGAVQDALIGITDPLAVAVTVDPDESARGSMSWPRPRGEPITVILTYPFELSLPVPITLNLGAQATSRIEYSNPP